jgi:hypothetical protein
MACQQALAVRIRCNTLRAMPARPIYFFGRNASMMALVGQQLKAAGLNAHGFMDEAQLVAELEKGEARLLVIGGGVEDAPRERMRAYCAKHNVLMLEHFGGPAALVENIGTVLG